MHYFVDHDSSEDELPYYSSAQGDPSQEEEMESPPYFNTFLRLPQERPTPRKTRCEPLVDYTHSQILISSQYVETLEDIALKKEQIQQEKDARARVRELTKHKRVQAKMKKVSKKGDRAAAKEEKK